MTTEHWEPGALHFAPPDPEPWERPNNPQVSVPVAGETTEMPQPWPDEELQAASPPEVGVDVPTADRDARGVEPAPGDLGAPDAVAHAKTSSRREQLRQSISGTRGRGIEWVRPTEFFARAGASVSGRGIDYTAALSQRVRSATWTGMRTVGSKARELPPVSAFGRRGHPTPGPTRAGVGMS